MKRVFWIVLPVLLALTSAAFAQSDGEIADPDGRFTVPIPTNWTAEVIDNYVRLQDPSALISAYALAISAETAQAGIESAWAIVDPDYGLEAAQTISPPPPPGEDELLVINYDAGAARFVQAVGRRVGTMVYVLIFDGELNALIQRNAQAQQIASGFTFTEIEQIDLSGVEPRSIDEALLAEFEAYANDLLARLEVPGAAVAIVERGQIIYTGAFGVRELGSDEPIAVDMQFMIGSTTKPITTTMMAGLVDEGIMTWDTPVIELLPNFRVADPALTQRFTVRNLVCACSGVPRRDYEFVFNADELTAQGVIDSLATFEFFTDFGEAFQYSNQLVATGGYAAAAAVDPNGDLYDTYIRAMQTRIFDPIGMTSTTFDFEAVGLRDRMAVPHSAYLIEPYYRPVPLSMEAVLIPVAPAGLAWSTVEDMARFMIMLMNGGVTPDGTRIVSEEQLALLWEPQVAVSAQISYGLGWLVETYKGLRLLHHGGNTLGFTSEFAFLPDADLGIVVLANAQGANLFSAGLRERLFELAYDQPMAFDDQIDFFIAQSEQQIAELEASIGDAPTIDAAETMLGIWTNDILGDVELRFREGALVADTGEFVVELRPNVNPEVEPGTLIAVDAPATGITFRFIETDGQQRMIIGENVTEYTFTRAGDTAANPYAGIPTGRTADGAFVLGSADAPITIVEFSDFACPACQRYRGTLAQMIETYVASGQARLEFRVLPTAGRDLTVFVGGYAECIEDAQPGAFWQAYDAFYTLAERGQYGNAPQQVAEQLGLDHDALLDCAQASTRTQTDRDLAQSLGVTGTPAIFVRYGDDAPERIIYEGTTYDRGGVPFEVLAAVIEAAQP